MKQTEIGLIPNDWEVKSFKEFTNRITVGIANSATHAYTDHGIIMFRNQNIKENTLDLNDLIYIKKDFAQKYFNKQLYENDLLIARTGYPGTTCVVPKEYEGCQTFTTLIATPKSELINSDYIAYYFNSDFGKKLFSAAQIGGAQKNVNAHTLSNIKICIPPLAEQRRIAKALSDVDAFISTTEKLIQKKKNIKHGTMQNLLTGKKRLPGFGPQTKSPAYKQTELGEFPEDWEVIKISGNYFLKGRIGWQGLKASEFTDKGPYLVTGTDFYNGRVNWESCYHISEERYEEDKALHVKLNDILITKDGTVGKVAYIDKMPKKVTLNSHLLIIRPLKEKLINRYLFYILNSNFFFDYYQQTQTGTTMASLSQDKISKFVYPLPSKEEQTAIANVLSSMDKEIETLNTKLEKYRNLKTAMMQQLLTGKIRLV